MLLNFSYLILSIMSNEETLTQRDVINSLHRYCIKGETYKTGKETYIQKINEQKYINEELPGESKLIWTTDMKGKILLFRSKHYYDIGDEQEKPGTTTGLAI